MTTTRLRLLLAGVLLICVMIGAVHFAAQPGPSALDHRVWDWAISHRSRHLTPVVIGITRLFTPPWSVLTVTVVALILVAYDRSVRRAAVVVVTVVLAWAVNSLIKIAVHRPRPPVAEQLGQAVHSYSYPSGHSMSSGALAFALLSVTWVSSQPMWHKTLMVCAAVAFPLVLGCTRIYLAVHWTTDVAAGFAVGAAAAAAVPVGIAALVRRYGAPPEPG